MPATLRQLAASARCRAPWRRAAALAFGVWTLAGLPVAAQTQSESSCGPLQNAFGPYDYRTERGNNLYLVEMAHFTPTVEALIKGNSGYLGGDLDYTLRAFPNHHRALVAVMRYGEKTKSPQPPNLRYSVECYFERALRFKSDDTTARMLYATFLLKNGRQPAALAELERVDQLAADNAFTHYNIGLIYLDARDYEHALQQAHKAYALDFPRMDLKERLVAAGKWREAAPAPAAGAASASTATSIVAAPAETPAAPAAGAAASSGARMLAPMPAPAPR